MRADPRDCGLALIDEAQPRQIVFVGDVALCLVVERQTKRIAEGHQGALAGVGLGFLDRAFVRPDRRRRRCRGTGTEAVADHGVVAALPR